MEKEEGGLLAQFHDVDGKHRHFVNPHRVKNIKASQKGTLIDFGKLPVHSEGFVIEVKESIEEVARKLTEALKIIDSPRLRAKSVR